MDTQMHFGRWLSNLASGLHVLANAYTVLTAKLVQYVLCVCATLLVGAYALRHLPTLPVLQAACLRPIQRRR